MTAVETWDAERIANSPLACVLHCSVPDPREALTALLVARGENFGETALIDAAALDFDLAALSAAGTIVVHESSVEDATLLARSLDEGGEYDTLILAAPARVDVDIPDPRARLIAVCAL